jgi:hypothetical protein
MVDLEVSSQRQREIGNAGLVDKRGAAVVGD